MVNLTIDGQAIEVPAGSTILAAAKTLGIDIPTLCHLDMEKQFNQQAAACRVCVVEIEKRRNLAPACATSVMDGMVILTESPRVVEARKTVINLMLSDHPLDCLTCGQAGNCSLQNLCYRYDIEQTEFPGMRNDFPLDDSNEFYVRDLNKCVACRRCVQICSNFQQTDAIGFGNRGFTTHPVAPFDKKMTDSICVSCGNCVSACPTGALQPKSKEKFRFWEVDRVKTTCSYCGVGCEMNLLVKNNKVVGVEPSYGAANEGLLCVKGKFGYNFINHPDRLKTPLIKKDGQLVPASWDEAYELIASKLNETKSKFGADALAGLASARVTNEENYLFMKMVRAVFGTNNIDHCARLCHASTVAGLATTLGSGAMTNSISEIVNSDVIFVTGSNTTETHPVIGAKIRQAVAKGAKLIVAEPRRIDLVKQADVFMQITPGTNVALYNGMMNVILEEGLQDEAFIKERCENYEELAKVIKEYTPERVAEICGINAEDVRVAARLYANAKAASIFYSMGVTQHSTGTSGVMGTSNLALLCGHIGKESSGVNPLRGQNNVQGACDMGCLPGDFTGYQKVANPEAVAKFEKAWGVKLSTEPGHTVTEIIPMAGKGEIKFLYIMGENPMLSDPDQKHVRAGLEALDFLVVQDIFLTETAELADVVLPAASFAEKDGTFTNTERRVQRVRQAIPAPGQAKADWVILQEMMAKLGYEKTYANATEIMEEIASVTPSYGGINYARLENESLQWPCPTTDHPGTKFLHKDKCARGLGLLKPWEFKPSAELPDSDYPFILSTGRILYHYHTKTMTGKVDGLNNLFPESFVEINPAAAKKLGVAEGGKVRISTRRGAVQATAKVTDKLKENVIFMPFHFADGPANALTNPVLDPIAKIPEFKSCAASVEKI
ncbi:MAG: formate dehydrogenase subunit alpha [Pedobacter sp.]